MDRRRRGPDDAELRKPRQADRTPSQAGRGPRRPASVIDAILELQATVGNRAVAASLDGATAQRQPAPRAANDGGALTLGADEAIPLQSATWSLKRGVKEIYTGEQRLPELEPTSRDVGDLVLTRAPDAHSAHLRELLATEHERGSLRLDRPSRDGALPAATLTLKDVNLAAYSQGRGEDPTETFTIAVRDLQVAGMGKEASKADAVATLQIGTGAEAWPSVPVISWRREGGATSPDAVPIAPTPLHKLPRTSQRPPDLIVKIAAGMAMTRLAQALDQHGRLTLSLSPKGAGKDVELHDALVTSVASTADGPNVVEVRFVGEF